MQVRLIGIFRIVSNNVRGISDKVKRKAVLEHFRPNADVLILQETHSTKDNELIWQNEWGGKVLYCHGTSAARGIAVFFKRDFKGKFSNIYRDLEGRCIIFDVWIDDSLVTIAAIYAPNQDNPNFFKEISKELRTRQENIVVRW